MSDDDSGIYFLLPPESFAQRWRRIIAERIHGIWAHPVCAGFFAIAVGALFGLWLSTGDPFVMIPVAVGGWIFAALGWVWAPGLSNVAKTMWTFISALIFAAAAIVLYRHTHPHWFQNEPINNGSTRDRQANGSTISRLPIRTTSSSTAIPVPRNKPVAGRRRGIHPALPSVQTTPAAPAILTRTLGIAPLPLVIEQSGSDYFWKDASITTRNAGKTTLRAGVAYSVLYFDGRPAMNCSTPSPQIDLQPGEGIKMGCNASQQIQIPPSTKVISYEIEVDYDEVPPTGKRISHLRWDHKVISLPDKFDVTTVLDDER